MNSGITVTGLDSVRRKIRRLSRLLNGGSKKALDSIGIAGIKIIKTKTLSGKDYTGSKFVSYSEEYKDDTGKVRVNLSRTGKMLGALTFKSFANGVIITVKRLPHGNTDTYTLALDHNEGNESKGVKKREFMNFTQRDHSVFVDILRRFYLSEISGFL